MIERVAGVGSGGGAESPVWARRGEEKGRAVRALFAQIAPSYDRLNGLLSLNLHRRWRRLAVARLGLRPGDVVLDVCCGTGDFIDPLRRAVGPTGRVFGVDFCQPMLEIARRKRSDAALSLGDACRLPVACEVCDAVTVGWGIRNVPDIDQAHAEIFRVLRPGGRFVSLDMAVPRSLLMRTVSDAVFFRIAPGLGRLFGHTEAYRYLPESTKRFLSREELVESMRKAGFVDCGFRDLFFGNICMHWGRRP